MKKVLRSVFFTLWKNKEKFKEYCACKKGEFDLRKTSRSVLQALATALGVLAVAQLESGVDWQSLVTSGLALAVFLAYEFTE